MSLYISQILAPDGSTYKIKDTEAREMLSHGLEIEVKTQLPDASAGTMGKLYFISHTSHNPSSGSSGDDWKDVYDEYITVRSGTSPNYTYEWEKIGNTDVSLGNYSVKTHTHTVNVSVKKHSYTPAGTVSKPTFSGTAATITVSGTPTGSVAIASSTSQKVTVSPAASGTATYTPTGTVAATFRGTAGTVSVSGTASGSFSGTTGVGSAHNHSITKNTSYLHKTSMPRTFSATYCLKNVATSKLNTTTITAVGGTTTIKNPSLLGSMDAAVASTGNTSVSYVTKGTGSVTISASTSSVVNGINSAGTGTQGGNNVMWNASVDADTETLSFVFKPLSTTNVLNSNTTATTTANTVTISTVATRLVSSSTSINRYTTVDATVATAAGSTTTVATGSVSASGSGATVATGNGSTAAAYTGVSASTSCFSTMDTSSLDGTAVVVGINANTGNESAHTHSFRGTLADGAISATGSYTPEGTVDAAFTGTGVRLLSASINTPATYTFTGTSFDSTGSYTPAGSVSQPTFSGTAATIAHEVTDTGGTVITTSQANS